MRKIAAAALASVALSFTAAPALATCDPGEMVIRFSHVTNTDKHPKGIAASMLADRVNAELNGRACMQVFGNASLYDDDRVLEAMLQGDVQLAAPSLSKFETFTKKFRVFDLPFIFRDVDAVDRYQNSDDGQALLDSMKRRGLQGLAFWHNGMKQLSASKPIVVPADARGLKFRIQPSDVLQAQFKALGAIPQKMAFSEVYGALQTGVVDGQENTWSNIYGQKFFEVQDSFTETNHGIIDYLLVASSEWWSGLPADLRDQFAVIIKEVTEERNAESAKVNSEARAAIVAAGGVIRTLDDEQRALWIKAMKPVWSKFEDGIGTEVIAAAVSYNSPN
ncbi:MAG: DctP family TRAP transporter solute-binding subunit [Rhodospirillales bacterium]